MTQAPTVALAGTPVLETERLILRAPVASDWPAFYAFMQSERSQHVRIGLASEALAWRAFGHIIGHWVLRGWGNFVITDRATGAALGACGPWFPATWPEREIGWSIWAAEAEGQGIAYEAARAAQAHVFDVLGWDSAVSYIDPANTRSAALAQRLGCVMDAQTADVMGYTATVWRHPRPAPDGRAEAYA